MNTTSNLIADNGAGGKTSSAASDSTDANKRMLLVLRWAAMLLIVVSVLVIFRSLPFDQAMSAGKVWIASLGFWGPVVLVLMYIVATVLFVPGTILTLAAGALFGLGVGMVAVSIGSTIGASLAFLIARYGAREKVARLAKGNRHFGAIDRAIAEGGWKIVGLLRLSPAIPFNLQNYLYGLTAVRFWPYVVTSWIAMLPGTFLFVYIGHATGAAVGADRQRSTAEWAMLVVGLLATVVVTVYVTRLARRKLQEQVSETADVDSEGADSVGSSDNQDGTATGPSVRSVMMVMAVAVVSVAAAVYVFFNAGQIERSLVGLFGPPQVVVQESYAAHPDGPTIDHSILDRLLKNHVDENGWVNYGALSSDEADLDAYLLSIAEAPFGDLGRNEKLAFLINAYNAATLKLILDHQPIDSIMDIPDADRWDAVRWNVGGMELSLNQIEHEQIRPHFAEPRIHFALVCAAVGCPPLRNEAYLADRIDEQLREQTLYVHGHRTWFVFDPESAELQLTNLYNWYGNDFEQAAGSVVQFAARYSPDLAATIDDGATPQPSWLTYDWRLNSVGNQQPR
ncbi:TVP38/TMEM64 family inner membrane protein YdjZ [Rubripirellula lacrimiformis]|uniref:TVP38/TMEM64 family inner membrane protein YdjZ n=1 Tax=Rubripirellula lacrimiformis TaxID=1930273 RepID=A0A517NEF7_9BACT|nr:VTT domain-containing protein [Rubripirellula lacrimiformis]QDT05517.1 TVP38/TMEM64 family inner membrane protein YdjZ [Rubripirellula lacrimiformis]